MCKLVILLVCVFYTNYVEASYNTGIKTRVHEHQPITHNYHYHHHHPHQPHAPTHDHYNQYSGSNNDRDYQTPIPNHYVHNDNSYQQQQREGDYYQQTPTTAEQTQQHRHPQPPNGNSQTQTGNWHNSENSITEYYTGCPSGHTGQLPYAYDCRRFLNCWHGRGHIQTCSVGTVFNPESLECDRPDKVKCEAALDVLGVQFVGKPSMPKRGNNQQPNYRAGRYTDIADNSVEVLCPIGAEGLQPHPSDCTRFINCANGNMHIQQCGPGTAYSIAMKVCDFKNKVDCRGREGEGEAPASRQDTQAAAPPSSPYPTGTNRVQSEDLPHTADILCLNGITGLFPYPFDYTKFINCKNGNTAIQNCVPNTAFSISKGYCEPLNEIHKSDHVMYIVSQVSYEYSQTLITCPPGTEGLHLYPFNAELYVKCIKSQMKVEPCNNAHVFSAIRRTCLPSNQVLKQERVRLLSELEPASNYRVTEENYSLTNLLHCPFGVTGSYPHPFDSTKYLQCVRGRLIAESCASGQAFSLSRKICSLKEEMSADDYVAQPKFSYGQDWRVNGMEITHGSMDGLTYLMCPPGLNGIFLHPFDCTKYIQCNQGATGVDSCSNGAVFSISRKECIPRDKVDAYDRVEYMTTTKNEFTNDHIAQYDPDTGITCNPGTFAIYPHPQDCEQYIRCVDGRISQGICPGGQVFSISRSICYNEGEVQNSDRSTPNRGLSVNQRRPKKPVPTKTYPDMYNNTNVPRVPLTPAQAESLRPPLLTIADFIVNCPPGATGRYPHPFDCRKFLLCSNGKTLVQACELGTGWSKEMEACDFIERIDCSSISPAVHSEAQYHCPVGVEGLYHHPYDSHKYLVCNRGSATVMMCAVGTVFSLSRKTCDIEANVLNSDRCNNGVYISGYDYTQNQNFHNRDQTSYNTGVSNPQWSSSIPEPTPSTPKVNGHSWTNMDLPRPQQPTYDQTPSWQQPTNNHNQIPVHPTRVWSSPDVHIDQRNPSHTVIFEEGSFEPNRNYKRPMYNTPLAPLQPTTPTTTASTILYAQPVGSQEDSKEIFSAGARQPTNTFTPQYFPNSNRENHTRQFNGWTPIRPIAIPRPEQSPHQDRNTAFPNTHMQTPIASYPKPSFQDQPSSLPQNPRTVPHLRPVYGSDDSGQKPLSESDFKITNVNIDQLPGQVTYNLNDFDQLPSSSTKHNTNDVNNLYGGLQPPLNDALTTTTVSYYSNPYEQTTQVPAPSHPTSSKRLIPSYPQLSNATIQTFPHQPHYSQPYSEVAHSRNASWSGRKLPQHSNIKPIHTHPPNYENINIKITTTPLPQYYGFNPPPYSNDEKEDQENPEAIMKDALKLMLKPYLDSNSKNDDQLAEMAQSHIMNLVSSSDKVTTATPIIHKPLLNKNTLVPSTTPHQEDVELILAGEQHHLVGVTTTQAGNHDSSTSYNSYQTPLQPIHQTHNHDHSTNWHKHRNHDPQHFKTQHSREFHKKHPNLPNPFNDPNNSHNTPAEGVLPTTNDFDLRSGGGCPFECGNGKCVEHHQVCDGVNNCGNRKDEQDCEHLGYELRLTGGHTSNMGRVEVKILGKWGYVCDDKFGLRDADVVCHELGFKMGAMEVRGSSYYAPSDVDIHFAMDEVECKGNESSLRECDFKGWGVNNCGPDEVVGVVCKVAKLKCPDNYWLCSTSKECIPTAFLCDVTSDCEDGSDESDEVCNAPIQYRLEGGRSSNEGRLEVFYRGEWGTVCDDDFGLKEAQVLCNSFGLYGKPEIVKNIYGPGNGPIWLDQVSCLGNETKIDECNHWSWGENNCNHTEDVGIKCTAGPKPSFSKPNKPLTDDSLAQDKNLESTLQFEQSELDDLGLYQGLWQRSSKAIHNQKKCGHFKSNLLDEYEHPEERVVNGTIAKRGRHPWQATIRTRGRGGISSHWCGAVIISRKLILTAAHCLAGYPKGSYFVRMGDHYANIAESSEIDSNIENWYIHEKFRDQKHMNNDIALILLKTPVRFNDYVQPVCLPQKGATLETNRMCTISGWGSIKSGTSTPSNILRSAQLPILADEVCSQKNVYANAMTEGMFCAGFLDESVDACDGDSGGPLVCSDEDGETLYGIISWGQHCGYANHPGVYVRVEKYIDWIYDKINIMIQQGKL